MARDRSVGVQVRGLSQLNRSLGRIDKDLRRESLRHIREVTRKVRDTARDKYTPKLTGELAKSLRYSVANRGAVVSSAHPGSEVHEYGGRIAPRGTPITIERARMVGNAVKDHADGIEDQLASILDRIAATEGF
jgi:phage gpG-like protein